MASIPRGFPSGLTPSQLNMAESAQWKLIVKQALADTRCATPAFLVSDLDEATQTVTVQIAIQERVRTRAGARWFDVPPIVNVPIMVPRGGGYSITLPLKKGDQGMLVFCDTCFDTWWKNGQENSPPNQNQPPLPGPNPTGSQRQNEVRRHYVHDCGFFPGLWSQNNLLSDYSTDSLQIRSDDGATIIDVSEDGVTIDAPGGTSLALTSSGIVINGTTVSAGDGGAALALMTAAWQTWFTVNVLPHISTGVIPPAPGATTILKGQ